MKGPQTQGLKKRNIPYRIPTGFQISEAFPDTLLIWVPQVTGLGLLPPSGSKEANFSVNLSKKAF